MYSSLNETPSCFHKTDSFYFICHSCARSRAKISKVPVTEQAKNQLKAGPQPLGFQRPVIKRHPVPLLYHHGQKEFSLIISSKWELFEESMCSDTNEGVIYFSRVMLSIVFVHLSENKQMYRCGKAQAYFSLQYVQVLINPSFDESKEGGIELVVHVHAAILTYSVLPSTILCHAENHLL